MENKSQMKALVPGSGQADLVEIPIPELTSQSDLVLKVICAGVCKTDIWASEGIVATKPNNPLGHEFCGEVVRKGSQVSRFELGERVAINPIIPCGHCVDCCSGSLHLCANTTMLGIDHAGAFAEYVSVPESQCYSASISLSPELIAYAEPIAAALSLRQFDFAEHATVSIAGDDRISSLSKLVLETMDISAVDSSALSPVDVLVVTSTNHLDLSHVKAGGTIILKGRSPYPWRLNTADVVRKRIKIVALNYAPFDEAISYLQNHSIALESLLGGSYPLSAFDKAFFADSHRKVFLLPCAD